MVCLSWVTTAPAKVQLRVLNLKNTSIFRKETKNIVSIKLLLEVI